MIAITGTPGCGKTTLAGLLAEQGFSVTDVHTLARQNDAVLGYDDLDAANVIDVEALQEVPCDADFIEGHLAHLLPVDAIWLIRIDPEVLMRRLVKRGYNEQKIAENVEAEAMDLLLQESLQAGVPVIQRDGTHRSPEELLSSFVEVEPTALKSHDLEPVDWSDWLLG